MLRRAVLLTPSVGRFQTPNVWTTAPCFGEIRSISIVFREGGRGSTTPAARGYDSITVYHFPPTTTTSPVVIVLLLGLL